MNILQGPFVLMAKVKILPYRKRKLTFLESDCNITALLGQWSDTEQDMLKPFYLIQHKHRQQLQMFVIKVVL